VGLVARVVEAAGIPTVCVATGRDLIAQVRPPRALFVNAPMGNNFGRPGDLAAQRDILLAALGLAATATGPVLADHPYDHGEDFTPKVDRTLGAMVPAS
jgi:D-proline reductase (dithiol) PrdB